MGFGTFRSENRVKIKKVGSKGKGEVISYGSVLELLFVNRKKRGRCQRMGAPSLAVRNADGFLWRLICHKNLQLRYGYIHLLDFKPNAAKEKYAVAQLFLYALALSLRTGIWLRNFVCGWFDEKDYFEFKPAEIVLKMGKVGKAEMRKYIRQF